MNQTRDIDISDNINPGEWPFCVNEAVCVCEHLESEHRRTGACLVIIGEFVRRLCPCNDFRPAVSGNTQEEQA